MNVKSVESSLWPARNVAEFAYCPRLFYFMEVEGIHVASHDTEAGQRIHKRVNSPSARIKRVDAAGPEANDADRPTVARSLTLSDQKLGLMAVLDLAEIRGQHATPIEYRKGKPRRPYSTSPDLPRNESLAPEPWPTDRIQLAFQTILLERAGYSVDHGILYYASERCRIEVPITDELRKEAMDTLEAARFAATQPRPLPLLNDPKCPRCSLHSVCLPDEIHAARGDQQTPRNLWPPRDDGIHIVAQSHGTKVGIRGATLHVTEVSQGVVQEIPLASLESLSLLGTVQISTQALHTLTDRNIPVTFLSAAGRLISIVDPMDSISADTRRNQVRAFDRPERCLELSRALIAAKIRNQRTLLMRNANELPKLAREALVDQAASAEKAESLASLRGHEGQAAAIYFEHFGRMLNGELRDEFDEHGRQRRPPTDPVNSCLSMAYSMLTHECIAALRTARLEPSIGAMHVSRPGRPALALDLMEPFRPLIADSLAITAFNRAELRPGHFQKTAAGCLFSEHGRKAFFEAYGRRMSDEITHPTFGYKLSYRRMLILHARMIAAWINGEIATLSFLMTR
jgi:CRISPR-associated protein Cas1